MKELDEFRIWRISQIVVTSSECKGVKRCFGKLHVKTCLVSSLNYHPDLDEKWNLKNGIGNCQHGCFRKWWYPQIINFNRDFHYKSSILGVSPYFWKHPHGDWMTRLTPTNPNSKPENDDKSPPCPFPGSRLGGGGYNQRSN